jgi:hypothetical protein
MAFSAEPILVSTIFRALRHESNSRKRKRLGTACSVLDDALRGGFDYSRIGCISGEKGTGKTAVSDLEKIRVQSCVSARMFSPTVIHSSFHNSTSNSYSYFLLDIITSTSHPYSQLRRRTSSCDRYNRHVRRLEIAPSHFSKITVTKCR